jgi:glycogen phosphorylase
LANDTTKEDEMRGGSRPRRPLPASPDPPSSEDEIEAFKETVLAKLTLALGKDVSTATDRDWFVATTYALRDRVIHRWLEADREDLARGRKRIYYLSLEFLIGRLLNDVAGNLQLGDIVHRALGDLGVDFERIRFAEPDAALGNGGLGRLAACFLESMASLGIPATGYGIRYDHGLFRQIIRDGWQQEYSEEWLSFGNPWEFERPEITYDITFGGWVETVVARGGRTRFVWHPEETIEAVAYDTPVVGWRSAHVNPLRLWSARAVDPMRLDVFNRGEHSAALTEQNRAEALSKILYPSDETDAGRELRLRQEYFFVSASLQDLVQRHRRAYGSLHTLPEHAAIQLNDTHPSVAIAELMRILVDLHNIPWDAAWQITVNTCHYTNHTLMPEALESWSVTLFERFLPRHLQIIYLINARHLEAAKTQGFDSSSLSAVSLIDERSGRRVRMGHLAFVGSSRVNGVSAMHSALLRQTVFRDMTRLFPERIVNVTNGITFRRWLYQANPSLTALLTEVCGEDIRDNPAAIGRFAALAEDTGLHEKLRAIKRANRLALARLIYERVGLRVDPSAVFDVQIKRIHEYKRQLLNLLETVALYNAMRADPTREWVPRVKIFAGKAAASYAAAKLVIKLAHDIAEVINRDPAVRDLLKVVFLANYNVSLAEIIIPAADLSEQISTAGMEASGTGNMKLALNGALTIGTLDGANIEIRDSVGADNIFIFGLRADEVAELRRQGQDGRRRIAPSAALAEVIEMIETGVFSPGEPHRFHMLTHPMRHGDHYMIVADFDSYWQAQRQVDASWHRSEEWARMCIRNIAGMSWFSADRAIGDYAKSVWHARF